MKKAENITIVVASESLDEPKDDPLKKQTLFVIEPRGIGATRWTTKNPPNYVERSHYLLGRTVDSGRVWDVLAAAAYLRKEFPDAKIHLAGEGRGGVLAIYAALLDEAIAGVTLGKIPESLMEVDAPALLNALRVCDIPDALGMVAPRKLTKIGAGNHLPKRTTEILHVAGGAWSFVEP